MAPVVAGKGPGAGAGPKTPKAGGAPKTDGPKGGGPASGPAKSWVLRKVPPNRIEDFDINIHILYDDTAVLENPHAAIGNVLETAAEADALTKLAHAIDSMFERVGTDLTDEQYLALPDWKSVVDAARNALSVLTGNA